jgi:peptide/nickel transport system permease protein
MRTVLRRLVQLVVVVLCVTFFSFLLLTLIPGDPVTAIVGFASPADHKTIAHELHLDQNVFQRYGEWLGGFLHGDLGKQYFGPTGRGEVSTAIGQHFGATLELMLYAMTLTLIIAIPMGVFAAYKAGTLFDRIANVTAFGCIALPDFALALVLSYWVGVKWGVLPAQGFVRFRDDPYQSLRSLTLPAISLAVGQIAAYMRLLRSDMIATLQEDYILMAKAKGMPTRRILWRHALRPSSLTLLTVAGLNIGALIGGTVVIEVIFGIPGMGTELYTAIFERQFVELQSIVALIAIGFVLINVAIDLLYTVLDPRIRDARAVG